MNIRIEIHYPAVLQELSTANEYEQPFTINYKNQDYGFETKLLEESTLFIISTKLKGQLTDDVKNRLSNRVVEIVNRSINRIRTFHHNKTYFHLVSPRIVDNITLIYEDENKEVREKTELKAEMPKYVQKFYDYLNEEEHYLSVSEKIEIDQLTYLHLMIDSYYNFIEGTFNECVINCSTAIESMIFPILQNWLKQKLYHKNDKIAQRILMDISMSNKYEIIFGTVENEFLKNQGRLLEILKGTNKLRNSIIHSGHQANREDADKALNYSAKFIYIIHFKIDDVEE